MDQALVSYIEYVRAGFHDPKGFDGNYGASPSTEQLVQWDFCRENVVPRRLEAIHVQRLAAVISCAACAPERLSSRGDGRSDRPAAPSPICTRRACPNATSATISGAGHLAEMDQPEQLARPDHVLHRRHLKSWHGSTTNASDVFPPSSR